MTDGVPFLSFCLTDKETVGLGKVGYKTRGAG